MTEVIEDLQIGNWMEAKEAHDNGAHVVTVAIDSPFIGDKHFPLIDGHGNDPEVFYSAVRYVVEKYVANIASGSNQRILVHCVAGRSRSAAVIVKVLKILLQESISEAHNLLVSRHNATQIHPALMPFLIQ